MIKDINNVSSTIVQLT